jgi:hypothetical protein
MQQRWHWRLVVVVFIVLCGLGPWLEAIPHCQASPPCATQSVTRTFLQPWRDDADRSPEDWGELFAELHRLGFREVILQWTSYGTLLIYQASRSGYEIRPYLDTVIRAARQQQINLWIGLHYDPDFWTHIDPQKKQTAAHLNRRLIEFSMRLPALVADIEQADPAGDTVRGWYISDEIDDVNWQQPERQEMLKRYLSSLRRLLGNHRPDWPVAISTFANGEQSPQAFASFWQTTLDDSDINTLLFQDGIGVKKLTLSQLDLYFKTLQDQLDSSRHTLEAIVEIFQLPVKSAEAFRTEAADFSRILQQLNVIKKHSQQPITVFSAPDHLLRNRGSRAKALQRAWLQNRHDCPDLNEK